MFAIWPVYQMAPSGVASGSCGREPGVGNCHSLKLTCTGPATMTGAGFGLPGKFLIRYAVTVSFCAADSGVPADTIMLTTLCHSSGE